VGGDGISKRGRRELDEANAEQEAAENDTSDPDD
jgi:hypothetical protein